jgi:hypothetical protein
MTVVHTHSQRVDGRSRRSAARLAVVAGALAASLLATVVAAGPAGAQAAGPGHPEATIFTYDLDSLINKVTSTTGVKLYLSLDASHTPEFSEIGDDVGITLETTSGSESHLWDVTLPSGTFEPTPAGGGTLETGDGLGAYGSVDLTLTPVGAAKTTRCSSSNYTVTRTEKLAGTIAFDSLSTGPHAWGDVGSTTKKFAFDGPTSLAETYGSGCFRTPEPKCSSDFTWDVGANDADISFGGGVGFDGRLTFFASRLVHLSSPADATRVDFVTDSVPDPTLTLSGGGATVKVRTSGAARGSGTVRSSRKAMTTTESCRQGSKAGKDTDFFWKAKFTAGSPTLGVTEQIEGPITLPSNGLTADISRTTS